MNTDTTTPIGRRTEEGLSLDLVQDNINQLGQLFPEVVKEGKVDFEALNDLLGNYKDTAEERYCLNWAGKANARREAQKRCSGTLRPCRKDSKNWDTTENLYIEGDNLEVLKLLQKSYHGRIKMIYIDPPYNTGKDFVYTDNYKDNLENYLKQIGEDRSLSTKALSDSDGRFHSKWLNMMYPRLKLARNLLTEDGVIFISIDDREVDNLIKICDEIFGAANFVRNISWQKNYSPRNDSKSITAEVENVIIYGRNPGWNPKKLPRTEKTDSNYKNPDNDKEPWTSSDASAPDSREHQGMVYAIQHPLTGELIYPANNRHWGYNQNEMKEIMEGWMPYELKDIGDIEKRASVCGLSVEDVRKEVKAIIAKDFMANLPSAQNLFKNGPWPRLYFTGNDGKGGIRRKTYRSEVEGIMVTNFWPHTETGHTDEATKELKELFDGVSPLETPKPVRLMSRILQIATDDNDIILDFFSGSATMAHAVMLMNAINTDSKRKFIMVQIPEATDKPDYPTLCEIGKERIRRAGMKLKADSSLTTQDLDVGFKVYCLDSSNINSWDSNPDHLEDALEQSLFNIKTDRTDEDLLSELLLKLGLSLTVKINKHEVVGQKVYEMGHGELIVCLSDHLTIEVAEGIGLLWKQVKQEGSDIKCRVVFKDTGFNGEKGDEIKSNTILILKQHGIDNVTTI
jgi:adenine-specific DNA-methyltransferase